MREGERTTNNQPAKVDQSKKKNEGQPKTPEDRDQEQYVAHVLDSTEGMLSRLGEFLKTPKGKIARAFTIAATLLAIDQAMPAEAEAFPRSFFRGRPYYTEGLEERRREAFEERQIEAFEARQRRAGLEERRREAFENSLNELATEEFKAYYRERARLERLRREGLAPAPILVQPIPAPYEQRPVLQGEAQRPLSEGEQNLLTERAVQQAQSDFNNPRGRIFQKTPTPPKGYETNGAALWYYNLAYARAYAELGSQQRDAAPPLTKSAEPIPRSAAPITPEARRETPAELRTALKAMAEFAASETAKGNRPYNEDPAAHLAPPDMARFSLLPHWKDAFERWYRDHVKALQKIQGKQSSLQDKDQEATTFIIK